MPHDSLTAITARRLWGTQANWPSAQSSDEVFFVGAIGTSWLINGLGQRIAQINVSVPEFFFVYDEAGHMTGKYGGSGNPLWETVWLGDLPVAVLTPQARGQFSIASDHLGAPHQITGVRSAVAARALSTPAGDYQV
jgi:hypothetical protein